MALDNQEGLAKERMFHAMLRVALAECPNLKAATLKRIIAMVAPGFMEGLF